jgi:CRISPR-associated protein Csx10
MKAITYQLFLEEPVLMTAPGGDPNADNSYSYIPGSALRGALASRYLQQSDATANDKFTRLFLDGQICFLNAYPVGGDGERALPTPGSWVLEKDNPKKAIFDRAQGEEPELPSGVPASFIRLEEDKVIPLENAFQVSIHTARNREMGRAVEGDPGSAVYQYRALAPETSFRGAIVVNSGDHEAEDTALLGRLLEDATLLLGGSQTAGYGLTVVKRVEEPAAWREGGGETAAITAGEPFTIYLLSDTILRDQESGRENNEILTALPPALRAKVELAPAPHTFTRMTWVGGFNTTWGLPLPQEWAVRKGGLWRLRAKDTIGRDEIVALEATGIGQRRAEGFGRVAVNPPWIGKERHLAEPEAADMVKEGMTDEGAEPPSVQTHAPTIVAQMNRRLLEQELNRRVVIAAQEKARRYRGQLSGSQLARLRLRVRRQQEHFDDFKQYLQGTRERKSADDQFRKFRVDSENFRDWLQDIADHPHKVWQEILPKEGGWQPPVIGADRPKKEDFDDQLTHHYAVRFIDAVCEQLAKKVNQNG